MVLLFLLTACDRRTVYNHFEHTPVTGWEKNDTLTFVTDPVPQAGNYHEQVGLRITGDYPFLQLYLIIEQRVLPSATTTEGSNDVQTSNIKHQTSDIKNQTVQPRRDTLNCSVINERGNATGDGVGQFQYEFPFTTLSLNEGERLHITIRHDMKREILPGVTDVGLRVTKAFKH